MVSARAYPPPCLPLLTGCARVLCPPLCCADDTDDESGEEEVDIDELGAPVLPVFHGTYVPRCGVLSSACTVPLGGQWAVLRHMAVVGS